MLQTRFSFCFEKKARGMSRSSASLQTKAGRISRFSVCFHKKARNPFSFLFKTKGKSILGHPGKPGLLLAFFSKQKKNLVWSTLANQDSSLLSFQNNGKVYEGGPPHKGRATTQRVSHLTVGEPPPTIDLPFGLKRKE